MTPLVFRRDSILRGAVRGGRASGYERRATVRDWHSANITLKKGLVGAKPESFCQWILELLGYEPGDELYDLYPGTGVMGRVLGGYIAEKPLDSYLAEQLASALIYYGKDRGQQSAGCWTNTGGLYKAASRSEGMGRHHPLRRGQYNAALTIMM